MSDSINIRGIRGWGFHGVLEHERIDGQDFIVDVELRLDLSEAAATDDLTRTVDYSGIAQLAHDHITGEPHLLIETLAEHIAQSALTSGGPRVREVTVSVHKPQAPIAVPFDDVIVTVTRSR